MTRTPLLIAIPLTPIELYIRTGTTPSDDHRIQFSPGLGYTLLRGSDVDSVDALPVSVEGTTAFLFFLPGDGFTLLSKILARCPAERAKILAMRPAKRAKILAKRSAGNRATANFLDHGG